MVWSSFERGNLEDGEADAVNIVLYAPKNGVRWTGEHVTVWFDTFNRIMPDFAYRPCVMPEGIAEASGIHFDVFHVHKFTEGLLIPLNFLPLRPIDGIEGYALRRDFQLRGFADSVFDIETGKPPSNDLRALLLPRNFDPLSGESVCGINTKDVFFGKRRTLVLGAGGNLESDLEQVKSLDADRIVVNRLGYLYSGDIDHWVSVHPECFATWRPMRAAKGWNEDYLTWGHVLRPATDRVTRQWGGSSGMFGATVALEYGYEEIILCGIPMDMRAGHLYDKRKIPNLFDQYLGAWQRHAEKYCLKVRSMSGWTRKLLESARKKQVRIDSAFLPVV
jgi:hypothetical protein